MSFAVGFDLRLPYNSMEPKELFPIRIVQLYMEPQKCQECPWKEAVKNKEKTITNKIPGSHLLKLIHRHCKFMKSKEEECHEIKAIVKELKIGRGGEDVIKD